MRKSITLGGIALYVLGVIWLLWITQGCVPPPSLGIRSSTGKELTSGTEIICKVGSKYPDPEDPNHSKGWRDGQIVDICPLGFHNSDMARKHFCVIEFPNIDYWTLRGDTVWKSTRQSVMDLKKFLSVKDNDGKYKWEAGFTESKERSRDYFVDYKRLLNVGFITQKQYKDIYDKDVDHEKIELTISDFEVILRNEDVHTRLSKIKDQTKGSVTTGTYSIGSGLNYGTVNLAEADIGTPLTGNLTFEHNDEETALSADVTFDTQTSGNLLKLTSQSGDEHNGTYSGARINYSTNIDMKFDETTGGHLANVEISNLALDITGTGNRGPWLEDGGATLFLVNRLLIKGDANGRHGLRLVNKTTNLRITNNIIYGIGDDGEEGGIHLDVEAAGANTWEIYNNTCIGCYYGIVENSATPNGTISAKNNLLQANTTDYLDANSAIGTTAKNITEDATSPDGAPYVSLNVHDATSSFVDYDNADYKLTTGGTDNGTIDDGDDLSGTFTDDIDGGVARDTWWIGAHELPVAGNGGAAKTGQVIKVKHKRR